MIEINTIPDLLAIFCGIIFIVYINWVFWIEDEIKMFIKNISKLTRRNKKCVK